LAVSFKLTRPKEPKKPKKFLDIWP
jgi:hypothetical protein